MVGLGSGCNTLRIEAGHGIKGGPSSEIEEKDIEASHFSIKIGKKIYEGNHFDLDVFLGPSIIIPVNKDGLGASADINPRLIYNSRTLKPYVGFSASMFYSDVKLKPQATKWGFLLSASVGLLFPMSSNWNGFVEYKAWHESNGSRVFGTKRPNPGFNSDIIMVGLEYEF